MSEQARNASVPRVIALEEHYLDAEIAARLGMRPSPLNAKLEDMANLRLAEMDAAGIDVQVLSHSPPGLQQIDASDAATIARSANDRLAAIVAAHPTRFAAFASLPTVDPQAAADELARTVTELGFKGAMIHGLSHGLFLDDRRFRPILARAAGLRVPVYLHPADPHPDVVRAYFGDYATTHPMFLRAGWGFTIETGTQAMRLVLSGVLDEHPELQFILGHLGETIPFLLARIDEALSRDTPMKNFRSYFTRHFHVTTSGFFSDPALLCCLQELGADRIMFSVDWPFASNKAGMDWFSRVALNETDKRKILSGNAERLLNLA